MSTSIRGWVGGLSAKVEVIKVGLKKIVADLLFCVGNTFLAAARMDWRWTHFARGGVKGL